jgi:GLPGLI family protein
MKKYALLLLVIQLTFSQNNLEIKYSIKYNNAFYNERVGTLQIDLKNETSLFKIFENIAQGELKEKTEEDSNQFNFVKKDGLDRYIFTDYKLDTLVFNENINRKNYTIKEEIPNFDWRLEETFTKKIGDFNCKKATLTFRGRNFIAWYSEEYPIKMGPWKFSGLPGLIMEIYEENLRYYWGVTSIKNVSEINISSLENKENETISIKEYVDIIYNKEQEPIISDLPRGVKVENNKIPRTRLEVKFEWEK